MGGLKHFGKMIGLESAESYGGDYSTSYIQIFNPMDVHIPPHLTGQATIDGLLFDCHIPR